MIRLSNMAVLMILGSLFFVSAQNPALEITIVYDNYASEEGLGSDWGFACQVEYAEEKLLFDAGRKSKIYEQNMALLAFDPSDYPALFISHHHGDHTAGLPWICTQNPDIACYLPESYLEMLKDEEIPAQSKGYLTPAHLFGPYYTTGDGFEDFREQGLIIKTASGGVLLTGCGHPGALEMIRVAEEELEIEIHTLVGGLHLMNHSRSQLEELATSLKAAGIRKICPTHCTGKRAMEYLAEAFGEDFIQGGSGKLIQIQ